jgi:hypothetical protein
LEKVKEVERMLHALIKSLKNKHLTPWTLDHWNPFKYGGI